MREAKVRLVGTFRLQLWTEPDAGEPFRYIEDVAVQGFLQEMDMPLVGNPAPMAALVDVTAGALVVGFGEGMAHDEEFREAIVGSLSVLAGMESGRQRRDD